jgi:hypothetical protein
VLGEMRGMRRNLVAEGRRLRVAGFQLYGRDHRLSAALAEPNDAAIGDRGMAHHRFFDQMRKDDAAIGENAVAGAIDVEEVALLVEVPDIERPEPVPREERLGPGMPQ